MHSLSTTEGGYEPTLPGTPPEGTRQPRLRSGASRRWRNPRQPIALRIKYMAGSGHWYVIEARGREYRFCGTTDVHSVMQRINGLEWQRRI